LAASNQIVLAPACSLVLQTGIATNDPGAKTNIKTFLPVNSSVLYIKGTVSRGSAKGQ
jgi:hypothetical protein